MPENKAGLRPAARVFGLATAMLMLLSPLAYADGSPGRTGETTPVMSETSTAAPKAKDAPKSPDAAKPDAEKPASEKPTVQVEGAQVAATDKNQLQVFFEADQIKKDTEFEVVLKIQNPGKELLSSPKAVLELPPNAPYAPKDPKQELAVSLAPGEEVMLRFPMKATKDLTRGTYPVTLVLSDMTTGQDAKPAMKSMRIHTTFSLVEKKSEMSKEQLALVKSLLDAWNAGNIRFVKAEDPENPAGTGNSPGTGTPGASVPGTAPPGTEPGADPGAPGTEAPAAPDSGADAGWSGGYDGGGAGGDSESSVRNKPKLIISNYSITPQMAKAGDEFTMDLTFTNTNSEKWVENITIRLNGAESGTTAQGQPQQGSVFTPVGSSNTFYIRTIAPEESVSKTIRLRTVPNAAAQNYSMNVVFEYEDEEGNPFTATETIGIPVVQQAKLLIGSIAPVEGVMGSPAMVDVDFYNTGKDTLTTFMVTIEGEGFTTTTPRYFVGNFAPGSSDHYSAEITPTAAGEIHGKVVFTFEDSTGTEQRKEAEFSGTIQDSGMQGPNGAPIDPTTGQPIDPSTGKPVGPAPGEEQAGGSIWESPILWILVAVAAAVVGIVIYRRRKRKKAEEDLTIDA